MKARFAVTIALFAKCFPGLTAFFPLRDWRWMLSFWQTIPLLNDRGATGGKESGISNLYLQNLSSFHSDQGESIR
jgi:hypothetical protein